MRSLIVGHGGRESALAWRMAMDSQVYAFMAHKNPSIIETVENTGGAWSVGNVLAPEDVASFASDHKIDIAMVSSDEPLEAGVVDALLARNIRCVGPTRAGAEIEWDKSLGRQLLNEVAPEANPFYRIVYTNKEIDSVFREIGEMAVAIKPLGLTGGKGVKVVGPHLTNNEDARRYAYEILDAKIGGGQAVIIEEKIVGAEFTIQAITDGNTIVFPPATYDYPYRYEGDQGPGTGGMGSYCVQAKSLPFMKEKYYEMGADIVTKVISQLRSMGRDFNGIMNAGFFITESGDVKAIEFNARFGDPECMNIMMILGSSWIDAMKAISERKLMPDTVKFNDIASTVIYLVSPDYALDREKRQYHFSLNIDAVCKMGCHVFFSASQQESAPNQFITIGTSRCVAIGATAKSLTETHAKINAAIQIHMQGPLEWRKDIATQGNIDQIRNLISSPSQLAPP